MRILPHYPEWPRIPSPGKYHYSEFHNAESNLTVAIFAFEVMDFGKIVHSVSWWHSKWWRRIFYDHFHNYQLRASFAKIACFAFAYRVTGMIMLFAQGIATLPLDVEDLFFFKSQLRNDVLKHSFWLYFQPELEVIIPSSKQLIWDWLNQMAQPDSLDPQWHPHRSRVTVVNTMIEIILIAEKLDLKFCLITKKNPTSRADCTSILSIRSAIPTVSQSVSGPASEPKSRGTAPSWPTNCNSWPR